MQHFPETAPPYDLEQYEVVNTDALLRLEHILRHIGPPGPALLLIAVVLLELHQKFAPVQLFLTALLTRLLLGEHGVAEAVHHFVLDIERLVGLLEKQFRDYFFDQFLFVLFFISVKNFLL